jgi:hypothetical protein
MDLADFPHLKVLSLIGTAVTGNIRDIGDNDFVSLQRLELPKGVYGCSGYECQSISEATDLVRAVYLLKKQRPALHMKDWNAKLSKDSPDWYEAAGSNQFAQSYPKILLIGTKQRVVINLVSTGHHSKFALFKRDLALDIDGKQINMRTTSGACLVK